MSIQRAGERPALFPAFLPLAVLKTCRQLCMKDMWKWGRETEGQRKREGIGWAERGHCENTEEGQSLI